MEKWTPVARFCSNCGKKIIGYRSSDGLLKVQCQYCGVVYVSKRISRRKERVEITAPEGQEFCDD